MKNIYTAWHRDRNVYTLKNKNKKKLIYIGMRREEKREVRRKQDKTDR